MLRAVTFDFWGTLYQNASGRDERLRLLEEALASHGQPRARPELEVAYDHVHDLWARLWREEHRHLASDGWLREMMAFLKADVPSDVSHALRFSIEEVFLHTDLPRPVSGVAGVLLRLAQRYRLGVISDVGLTPGRVLRELLRRDGLLPHFSALTFSDETGSTKPIGGAVSAYAGAS